MVMVTARNLGKAIVRYSRNLKLRLRSIHIFINRVISGLFALLVVVVPVTSGFFICFRLGAKKYRYLAIYSPPSIDLGLLTRVF